MRRIIRLHHWWIGKIPPALAVVYLALSRDVHAFDVLVVVRDIALFLVSCLGIGGFGYLLTDAFDVEEDRRSGKDNGWAALEPGARAALVALLLLAAWLPWRWLPHAPVAATLIALEFLLFGVYAVPPMRLKERGFAGIVIDALYAHVLPTMVVWVAFSSVPLGADVLTPALLATWMLLMGIRHLARHQHDDLDRDRIAGVRTFAVGRGREATMRVLAGRVLPLEAAVAALTLLWLAPHAPMLLAGFAAHTAWELHVVRRRWLSPIPPFAAMSDTERHDIYAQRLLSGFVERWLAPLALTTLVLHQPRAIWLVPLHLLVFGSPLRAWWRDVRALPGALPDAPVGAR